MLDLFVPYKITPYFPSLNVVFHGTFVSEEISAGAALHLTYCRNFSFLQEADGRLWLDFEDALDTSTLIEKCIEGARGKFPIDIVTVNNGHMFEVEFFDDDFEYHHTPTLSDCIREYASLGRTSLRALDDPRYRRMRGEFVNAQLKFDNLAKSDADYQKVKSELEDMRIIVLKDIKERRG